MNFRISRIAWIPLIPGMEKEKNAMVSINWPQAVLRVQYADIQVQESVMLEEANEGEKD